MTAQRAGASPEQHRVPGPRDALDSLPSWRLRPGVTVTVLGNGVHVRSWSVSVTVEGGTALPVVWRHLADAFASDGGTALAREVPTGTRLRGALISVLEQLRAHEVLVERDGTTPDGPAGEWLSTIAHHPAEADGRLREAHAEVRSASPRSPLALAAVRALAHSGVEAVSGTDSTLPDGQVLLTASTHRGTRAFAVAAGLRADAGFVTPVGSAVRARQDAAELARRLSPADVPGVDERATMGTLVASAGAQRLMCAVAGLRDPSEDAEDSRLLPGRPAALVARAAPLRGEYRTWLGAGVPDLGQAGGEGGEEGEGGEDAAQPRSLAEAMAAVAAFGDDEIGVLDAPAPGALPQLPACLVRCATPDGGHLLAGAARADLARLEAVCRAAELGLSETGELVVGANEDHARGRALRRLALGLGLGLGLGSAGHGDHGDRGDADEVGGARGGKATSSAMRHPQARHWWSVLIQRLGVDAQVRVSPVAGTDGNVYRAVVRRSSTGSTGFAGAAGPPGPLLAAAVEATPGDAAALAALSAVVRVQAMTSAPGTPRLALPSGAPASLAASSERAPWEHTGWTSAWLADIASREATLHKALEELTGVRLSQWRPPPTAPGPAEGVAVLWSALRQGGFAVLAPDSRDGGQA